MIALKEALIGRTNATKASIGNGGDIWLVIPFAGRSWIPDDAVEFITKDRMAVYAMNKYELKGLKRSDIHCQIYKVIDKGMSLDEFRENGSDLRYIRFDRYSFLEKVTDREFNEINEAFIGRKNIDNTSVSTETFTLQSMRTGTIVMFRDNTYGVYLEGKIGEFMKTKFEFEYASSQWFLSHSKSGKSVCFFDLSSLDEDLRYKSGDFDVIRIYDRRLKDDEIKRLTAREFYHYIVSITNKMPYTERK